MNMRWYLRILLALFLLGTLTGWKTLERKTALPARYANEATIDGMAGVRYSVNTPGGIQALLTDLEQALETLNREQPKAPINYLSLSGGGGHGAFGAGLLYGWSQSGTRPEFNMVTGVSTGALMATFAFLGESYDAQLKTLYTTISKKDVVRDRGYALALLSDGMGDTTPLYQLITKNITPELLRKIAYEYKVRGRVLMIGTTNLDTTQPIIWNMGKIAAYDSPEALRLFRKVMLASASLPGFFSPVMLDAEYKGNAYQEMHVDGGVSRTVFLYPASLFRDSGAYKLLEGRKREAYLIRNGLLDPGTSQTVERKTLSIANQALRQFAHSHGEGDVFLAYMTAKQDGFGFNLAYITRDFNVPTPADQFNTQYMRALFDYAQTRARNGYPWAKEPPGLNEAMATSVMKYRESLKAD